MENEIKYKAPEFKVLRYKGVDVITTSGETVTPPWGGEVVTDPDFPPISF